MLTNHVIFLLTNHVTCLLTNAVLMVEEVKSGAFQVPGLLLWEQGKLYSVQYIYKLCKTKRDSTSNKLGPYKNIVYFMFVE